MKELDYSALALNCNNVDLTLQEYCIHCLCEYLHLDSTILHFLPAFLTTLYTC